MNRVAFVIMVALFFSFTSALKSASFPDFWLQQTTCWPTADEVVVAPPANAALRFTNWGEELLPAELAQNLDLAKIPYLQGWGYLFTNTSPTSKLQMRTVLSPLYPGAQQFTEGAVLRCEFSTPQTIPESSEKMLAFLQQYLNPQRLEWPVDPRYAPPIFWRDDDSAGYALPNDFYAITNGRELRVASFITGSFTRPSAILDRLGSGNNKTARDGSLNYRLSTAMEDPWIVLAALDWPAWPPKKKMLATAPVGGEERFKQQLQLALREEWQPSNPIYYLRKNGFVYVTSNNGFRLRVRETVAVLPKITHGLLIAVELPDKFATTDMSELLRHFLQPELLNSPALDSLPAAQFSLAGGMHYAQYRQEDEGRIPLDIFAWSDSKMLLIALVESNPEDCPTCNE